MENRTWLRDFATPFFDACGRGELILPKCDQCGSWFWYPSALCGLCHAKEWHWETASGNGSVYTFTAVYRPLSSSIPAPYVVATIELDEGVRMMSNIVECPMEEVEIGMPVEAVFGTSWNDLSVPFFRPSQR